MQAAIRHAAVAAAPKRGPCRTAPPLDTDGLPPSAQAVIRESEAFSECFPGPTLSKPSRTSKCSTPVLRAAPTLLSNAISLFKESALVSAVGMADLMFIGQNISNNTARPVEVLTAVAAIYFIIAFPLTRVVTLLEQKLLRKFSA